MVRLPDVKFREDILLFWSYTRKQKEKKKKKKKNAIDMENANSAFFCKNIFKKNAPKMLELDLSSKAKIS